MASALAASPLKTAKFSSMNKLISSVDSVSSHSCCFIFFDYRNERLGSKQAELSELMSVIEKDVLA
ncbi:MAG: hypothetical protein AAFO84_08705, partial [Cyanobacteria bacterium J06598_1]